MDFNAHEIIMATLSFIAEFNVTTSSKSLDFIAVVECIYQLTSRLPVFNLKQK